MRVVTARCVRLGSAVSSSSSRTPHAPLTQPSRTEAKVERSAWSTRWLIASMPSRRLAMDLVRVRVRARVRVRVTVRVRVRVRVKVRVKLRA